MDNNEKVYVKLKKHQFKNDIQRKRKILFGTVLAIFLLITCIFTSYKFGLSQGLNQAINKSNSKENSLEGLDKFNNIYQTLLKNWYFGRDLKNPPQDLLNNAIKGMLDKNNDKYTEYMTSEEYKNFVDSINQNFSGIGVVYVMVDNHPIVQRVLKNSPAEKAGVLAGDIINKVDNQDVVNKSLTELSKLVRGEQGSTVNIEFLRKNSTINLKITRDVIHATADSRMVSDKIGLLEINSFGEDTGSEVKQHLESLLKSGAKNLIIDVRNNGGGFLNAVEEIASLFLESNQIIIQQELADGSDMTSYSKGNVVKGFDKIVMLANKNSASCSEVLLAALNENLNVPIFGQTSYGKGVAQTLTQFGDGSVLKYTYSQWLTPKGNKINGVGIKPTFPVKLHPVFQHQIVNEEVNLESLNLKVDSVSEVVAFVQNALDYLGYKVDRFDGYFSNQTLASLKEYQSKNKMVLDGIINRKLISAITSSVMAQKYLNPSQYDLELKEAIKYINGK